MTQQEIADKLNIHVWKVKRYCQLLVSNVDTGVIQERLELTNGKLRTLTAWYVTSHQIKIEIKRDYEPKRYWQNEAEMERQDYDNCIRRG